MEDEQVSSVKRSPFVGVGLDESTDRSSEKHLVFIVRWISHGKVTTTYLKIAKVADGKADTIFQKLLEVFNTCGIPIKKVGAYSFFYIWYASYKMYVKILLCSTN